MQKTAWTNAIQAVATHAFLGYNLSHKGHLLVR